jgi:hypothetical protein
MVAHGHEVKAGNGHGIGFVGEMKDLDLPRPMCFPIHAPSIVESAKRRLSPEQFQCWYYALVIHGNIFPNLSFLNATLPRDPGSQPCSIISFRLWRPLSHDTSEVWSWFAVEKDAHEEFKELSCQTYTHTFGVSGIFEQDDMENWKGITANAKSLGAKGVVLNYELGQHLSPDPDWPGPGEAYPSGFCERSGLDFFEQWLKYLEQ